MPRRNVYLILWISIACLLCFQRAGGRFSAQADRFVEVLGFVDQRYVSPVSPEELLGGALEGMVGTLDEYSGYIPPRDYQEMEETLDQQFGGIGVQVVEGGPSSGELTVASPLAGTPAYAAGVLAGDVIIEIDGQATVDMARDEAVMKLRGAPDTPVQITVRRTGEADPLVFDLVRKQIVVDSVLGDTHNADGTWNFMLPGDEGIALVRINSFGQRTAEELKTALEMLQARGMKALILDLRNDPGGILTAAIEVCDLFISSGRIVSTRQRDGQGETWDAKGPGTFDNFPMVVLVNRFSASASEIVAACLQDHHRAVVIGERTWGKGSVQELVELDDREGAIRLTVATYWRPSGKNIHRLRDAKETDEWGVRPNEGYEVKLTDEEMQSVFTARRQRDIIRPGDNGGQGQTGDDAAGIDPQMAKALAYLRGRLAEEKP